MKLFKKFSNKYILTANIEFKLRELQWQKGISVKWFVICIDLSMRKLRILFVNTV